MPFKNKHPLYSVWQGMKCRCFNKNFRQWSNYGGRGITVCSRWLEPKNKGFQNFLSDMGDRPAGFSLDRINNDGDYEPSNCRWSSRKNQQRNQSVTRKVVIEGCEYIAADLSELSGIKTDTIVERAKKGMCYSDVIRKERYVYTAGLAKGGIASGAIKKAKTHCKNGHEFTQENTLLTKEGWRSCRRCHADRQKSKNKKPARGGLWFNI